MNRTRIMLATFVDLDPVPGTFHTADSARSCVNGILQQSIPHYTPIVSIVSYARHMHNLMFDYHNMNYSGGSPEYNMLFIKSVMNHLNDMLSARGYVFLNEAREALGFPLTREGQLLGWTEDHITWDSKYLDNGDVDISFYVEGCIIDKAFEHQEEDGS